MIKTIEVISLSSGTLGEDFAAHELRLGIERLEAYGCTVKFGEHALCGIQYVKEHPEARAQDLLQAFADPTVDMILCAIGGDDTYRLLPYLFSDGQLQAAVRQKVFLGFSDSTVNHFMLHKVGLNTFYGQSFLSDVAEMEPTMLPYTRSYFEQLLQTGTIHEVHPSDVWYEERKNFDASQLGVKLPVHPNNGFALLQGEAVFHGKILGGCLDTLYDMFNGDRYADMPALCREVELFPSLEDWRGKILLLETSEERATPEKYAKKLAALKETGLFTVLSGVLVGKPADEMYAREYRELLLQTIDDPTLPILWNVNIGHAAPRCILPFGINATVDANAQCIRFAP